MSGKAVVPMSTVQLGQSKQGVDERATSRKHALNDRVNLVAVAAAVSQFQGPVHESLPWTVTEYILTKTSYAVRAPHQHLPCGRRLTLPAIYLCPSVL